MNPACSASLCVCEWMNEWMAETSIFFPTYTETVIHHLPSKWGHKYINSISRTALRVTSRAFDRFICVKAASYHIHTVKVFTASCQNKSLVLDIVPEILDYYYLVECMWYYYYNYCFKTIKKLDFLINTHTIFLPRFHLNSKSSLFTKK